MDKLSLTFTPLIDLPLIGITLVMFLWHINRWAQRDDIDTSVDMISRLPSARIRVVALFVCVLLFCWLVNFAVWSILAILLGSGLVIALLFSGDVDGGAFGLVATAYLIREWSFGFPQMMLHPPRADARIDKNETGYDDLLGKTGVTISPIRPIGEAEIDGVTYTVASDTGRMLDAGIEIKVTSLRNGRPCIAPASNAESGR